MGDGPIQEITTTRHDYVCKSGTKREPIMPQNLLYIPTGKLESDTVNRLSYPSNKENIIPTKSCKPILSYKAPECKFVQRFLRWIFCSANFFLHSQYQWKARQRRKRATCQCVHRQRNTTHGLSERGINRHHCQWNRKRPPNLAILRQDISSRKVATLLLRPVRVVNRVNRPWLIAVQIWNRTAVASPGRLL